MRFRPCIDIHNGKVKQIVGSSLEDRGDSASENFVSERGADFYARMYQELGLSGGHIILLNPQESPFYEMTRQQGILALKATPGLLQIGGGINDENATGFIEAGASHVIVTSFVFKNGSINRTNLKKLVKAVGKERLVLDLSCKRVGDDYYVVTDQPIQEGSICEKIEYNFPLESILSKVVLDGINFTFSSRISAYLLFIALLSPP